MRSDIYSLGCSFYFMLTGRPPFPDGTVLQKLLQHQGDHPPDPRSIRPELPPEVTWILARLLAKNPAQRFQQPSELTAQLADLGDKLGVHLSSSRTVLPRPHIDSPLARLQHHLPWAVPVAVLLLVVFAIDYFDSSQVSEPPVAVAPVERATAPAVAKSATPAPTAKDAQAKSAAVPAAATPTKAADPPAAPVAPPSVDTNAPPDSIAAPPEGAADPAALQNACANCRGA